MELVLVEILKASLVIMTDKKSDGSHIRTLLINECYMRPAGYIYIAQPPLSWKQGKNEYYIQNDEELKRN